MTVPQQGAPGDYSILMSSVAETVPDSTAPQRLRNLERRYTDYSGPVIAALPPGYPIATMTWLRTLLARSAMEGVA
jgi:hypothetical protein